jgi:hypothetical protein
LLDHGPAASSAVGPSPFGRSLPPERVPEPTPFGLESSLLEGPPQPEVKQVPVTGRSRVLGGREDRR